MRTTYSSGVYAVIDLKTGEPVGPILQLHRHDTVAVREFAGLALDERTMIHKWPDDYVLVQVGFIVKEDDGTQHPKILPEYKTIVSARNIIDAQQQSTPNAEP